MNNYFEGWYYKNQKDNNVISFIPGRTDKSAFIQIICNNNSYNFNYPLSLYKNGTTVAIGESHFSKDGIEINIFKGDTKIKGAIKYFNLTPVSYDIMGPFKYFPMQCQHGVLSMYHSIIGSININGQNIDLSGGVGYIESDCGKSFPKNYLWIHCSDFPKKCSVMLSVADIPFFGTVFKGCICIVYYNEKQFRLATYLGAKIIKASREKVILKQGKYKLEVDIERCTGQPLFAPVNGQMARIIKECVSCSGRFRFYKNNSIIFDYFSKNISFEYSMDNFVDYK